MPAAWSASPNMKRWKKLGPPSSTAATTPRIWARSPTGTICTTRTRACSSSGVCWSITGNTHGAEDADSSMEHLTVLERPGLLRVTQQSDGVALVQIEDAENKNAL